MIKKELKHEMRVAASADDIWAVYSSPDLPNLILRLLPSVFDNIEIVEGNGGVGTVLHLTFPPGSVPLSYKEKFVTINGNKRLKEVKQIQGGYLDMGCTFYMDSFHIEEKGCDSCVIVSKTEYEVPNEEIANQVELYISIDSLASMAKAISDYVLSKVRKELKHELEVAATAKDIWEIYSSPDLPKLIVKLLPSVFEEIEIVEGNGSVGTILHVTYPPGSIPRTYKEKFVTIDDCERLKEVKQIEGGYFDMGCTFYMDSFHILEKGCNSCVIVSKTEYEVPNKEIESQVEPYISIDSLANMAKAISDYVLNKVRKELKHELVVDACADDVWEVYSSPDFPKLIVKLLPSVFEKIEIVEGNGGLGTVLHITFPPGSVPLTYKEKFVTIDDRKRLKEVKQIQGGYLDMGCTFYMDSFHILPKHHCHSCVIVSKTEYEIPNKEIANKVEPYISIDSLANMATAISSYVLEKKKLKI